MICTELCCSRSTAPKKCALFCTIGPPKVPLTRVDLKGGLVLANAFVAFSFASRP